MTCMNDSSQFNRTSKTEAGMQLYYDAGITVEKDHDVLFDTFIMHFTSSQRNSIYNSTSAN